MPALATVHGSDLAGPLGPGRLPPPRSGEAGPQAHGERVSIRSGLSAGPDGQADLARALSDVRWYRSAAFRAGAGAGDASLIGAGDPARPGAVRAPGRPVHAGVKAYQRVMAAAGT